MLRGDGFLLRFVADLVGLGGDEVDEFSAAVYHQLPGIVCHADVGERFFDHLVDGSPGDGQVVVVARRRGHPGCRWLPERRSAPALTGSPSAPARGSSARGAGEGRAVPREATLRGAGGWTPPMDERAGPGGRYRAAGAPGQEGLRGLRAPSAAAPATAASTTSFGRRRRRLMNGLRKAEPPNYPRAARFGSAPSSPGGGGGSGVWPDGEGGREAETG